MQKALILGITGQDGAYLSKLLLEKGYEVHGMVRRSSVDNTPRLRDIMDQIDLHYGDLSDSASIMGILDACAPDEVYNLAAMSDVGVSFKTPIYSADVTGTGTIRVLEAVRAVCGVNTRFYQASSSEMFGSSPPPQSEAASFHPRSPYGCAKVFSFHAVVNYREAYGMHASNGVLFNHESPLRGTNFVTRKIAKAVARITMGLQKELRLGNLEARRDWGFAGDYVEAMWRMLQQRSPGDYVVATGEAHSVREFVEEAFTHVNLDYRNFVKTDPSLFRPSEVEYLLGDSSKAKRVLGWEPKVKFQELVKMMVDAEL
jgi:GDPmannose 4,6-dehydratase